MDSTATTILIIEDEPQIRRFLRLSLQNAGYRLIESETGRNGLLQAAQEHPDILILDLGLPDMDGLELLRELREWSEMPVIVLSARGQEKDKITALDAGANDYLTKPFSVNELMARLRVALRMAARLVSPGEEPVFEVGELRVDFAHRQVFVSNQERHLTPIQYRLLATLIKHAGKVLTHRQLLREVWGPEAVHENHYVRVFMGQLRQKLEPDPTRPRYLLTEPGVGYRLATE